MSAKHLVFAGLLAVASGAVQAQETTYTFQSQPFENVIGTYTTAQSVSGTITLSQPLPPSTTTPAEPLLVSYSFTDGVLTLDTTNSQVVGFFSLTTDASGAIESYGLTLWESPLATMGGEIFSGMDIVFNPGAGATGCTPDPDCGRASVQINSGDIECTSVAGGVCFGGVPLPSGGNGGSILRSADVTGFDPDFDEAVWSGGPLPEPNAIPTLKPGAFALLILALAVIGAGVMRRRSA